MLQARGSRTVKVKRPTLEEPGGRQVAAELGVHPRQPKDRQRAVNLVHPRGVEPASQASEPLLGEPPLATIRTGSEGDAHAQPASVLPARRIG
jgi:hypothetical protein